LVKRTTVGRSRWPIVSAPPVVSTKEEAMPGSVYKIIELVGTSTQSWEDAAKTAVERASRSLRDLRIAEISQLDMHLKDGKVEAYRAKVKVSFKYEGGD
jgi:flavin-binding protein dodecin